jgi:hypothetical protein
MRRFRWVFVFAAATWTMAAAADGVYLADAIKQPPYALALTNMLASVPHMPSWTGQVIKPAGDYVGNPATYATIDGVKYELFNTCKAHDCADNKLEVMFSPNGAQAWGALVDGGKPIAYLGGPTPAQQSALKAALQQ